MSGSECHFISGEETVLLFLEGSQALNARLFGEGSMRVKTALSVIL